MWEGSRGGRRTSESRTPLSHRHSISHRELARGELVGQEAVHQGGLTGIPGSGNHHAHAKDFSRTISSLELLEVGEDRWVRLVGELVWQRERVLRFWERYTPLREGGEVREGRERGIVYSISVTVELTFRASASLSAPASVI
jgi:hypothetical protein